LDDFVTELSDLELDGLVVLAFDNGGKSGDDSLSNWDDSMLQLNRFWGHHPQLGGLLGYLYSQPVRFKA
jgi:hypothetical protein